MKYERLYTAALILVSLLVPVRGQDHYAKVSTDATLTFGIATDLPDPNHPTTVDLYHTDVEVSFRYDGWDIIVSHDAPGTNGMDIVPQEALLYANANSCWVLPSIPIGFEFIGAKPGQPFWILPQSSGTGALPLGFAAEKADTNRLGFWNPQDARGADSFDRWFEVQLLDVRGPEEADFALWQADGISAPVVFMSTRVDGITDEDVFYLSSGSHTHLNWGFTQPGTYEIDFRISTVLRCDPWLTADWAPPGNSAYYGDGWVDFQDYAWMAAYWGQPPSVDDPNTFMFADPNDPFKLVGSSELANLADQWLLCGYPNGDDNSDPNATEQSTVFIEN